MAQHGFFHWNELLCGDVDAAKAFYGETLGWSFTAMPMKQGNYWIASIGAAGSMPVRCCPIWPPSCERWTR